MGKKVWDWHLTVSITAIVDLSPIPDHIREVV
ncbi:hypothetical protein C7972_103327 [Arenibacter sp. ARW7G5Y1]|nr:hypothetical protein C7972_103327 [Arenibacter sp. ARW7G5Y1]